MRKPLVSICIPTYNGAHLVRRAIESCLAQTYDHVEVLVIDDCSKDNTVEVVGEYVKKSPRVRLIKNEHNLGAALNFLKTFERAHGEYVQHLGQDDWLDPNHIAEKVAVFEHHPDIAFVANCMASHEDRGEGKIVHVGTSCKPPGFYFFSDVAQRFYKEPGLLGFFCMMRKKDAVMQYQYRIPNVYGYDEFYKRSAVIDNLLLLKILHLPEYKGHYYYTDATAYHSLAHAQNYSKTFGALKQKSIADIIKYRHIDRVGYEYFYRTYRPSHLFRYRVYMGKDVLGAVFASLLLRRGTGSFMGMLKTFFEDYSLLECSAVLLGFMPHIVLRCALFISRKVRISK